MTDDQIHLETASAASVIRISHRALFNNCLVPALQLGSAESGTADCPSQSVWLITIPGSRPAGESGATQTSQGGVGTGSTNHGASAMGGFLCWG